MDTRRANSGDVRREHSLPNTHKKQDHWENVEAPKRKPERYCARACELQYGSSHEGSRHGHTMGLPQRLDKHAERYDALQYHA